MSTTTDASEGPETYPPVDLSVPQFTLRAVLTGMILGAILAICNVYLGLKIGWGINMSVTAAVLSFGLYTGLSKVFGTRSWNILENNVNQTAASSAASISSAGLVAPIPAWTMLTGEELTWLPLSIWLFAVSILGVVVAVGLRRQMLIADALPFPNGIATGATLREMYGTGKEAMARFYMLLSGAVLASAIKVWIIVAGIKKVPFPGSFSTAADGPLASKGLGSISMYNLTFAFDPSLLMVGIGVIIGFRTCLSMLLGAIIGWVLLGPEVLEAGAAAPGAPDKMWFGTMIKWMLWPGVAMMVTASLTSFAFSWRSVLAAITGTRKSMEDGGPDVTHDIPRRMFLIALFVTLIVLAVIQLILFDIGLGLGVLAVLFTFLLAIVAARVSGETGVTPVGAMGKVTQLSFGIIEPGNVTSNLMAANVTGGSSSQAADLLHDMKTGLMVGASPRFLAFAQFFGVLAGSLAGAAFYLVLVDDPKTMLLTEEWAAPAVAQWKAVAELFKEGIQAMPAGALDAMAIAGGIGVVLAIIEKVVPKGSKKFVPSPTAMGLAMVIPASYAMSMFVGGLLSLVLMTFVKSWSTRFLLVLAAGIVAGESLTGAVDGILTVIDSANETPKP